MKRNKPFRNPILLMRELYLVTDEQKQKKSSKLLCLLFTLVILNITKYAVKPLVRGVHQYGHRALKG